MSIDTAKIGAARASRVARGLRAKDPSVDLPQIKDALINLSSAVVDLTNEVINLTKELNRIKHLIP